VSTISRPAGRGRHEREERTSPPEQPEGPPSLNAGNYLCFALACRWISSLVYVAHPGVEDDLPRPAFVDDDPSSGLIQPKAYEPASFDWMGRLCEVGRIVVRAEPTVPFVMCPSDRFLALRHFDLMVLCQSPDFTPVESDALIPVIKEYMQEI
jgi:hypothetical protein